MINFYKKLFKNRERILVLFFIVIANAAYSQSSNELLTAWTGTIDPVGQNVTDLPGNGRIIQLISASTVSPGAKLKVIDAQGAAVPLQNTLNNNYSLEITAQDGSKRVYTISTSAGMPVETMSDVNLTVPNITNKLLDLRGAVQYHITDVQNPLKGSFLDINSDNVWLYFDNIKPSVFKKRYLDQIVIAGERAKIDTNVRLVQWRQGSVLISHSSIYQPLQVFNAAGLGGTSMKMDMYTYYRASQLGAVNKTISSFVLKKGYMATFAENEDGTGRSKVYIASDNDLTISSLPDELKNKVSFVRVFPWRWVVKKGWTSGEDLADTLGAKWTYNWNNNLESSLDAEYVPIRQTQWWPGLPNDKKNVNHLLTYNEPDSKDQSNMTVDQAIGGWPELMQSGLRLGSPAVTDGGLNWLYSFMDKADELGYRVDFVAVHWYKGGQSAQQFYNFLKDIHNRTKRPIWITEWNNGANWTCCKPSYQDQEAKISQMLHMLDTASFVERYSLYEWVEDTRQMFSSYNPLVLTPAGIVYRDKISPLAYNPAVRAQTITFSALSQRSVITGDFDPAAKASSGLPVTYTSSNPQVAVIVNGKVRVTGLGTTDIIASQAGNYTWDPAVGVARQLTVIQPYTLPANNFSVKAINETCASNNNGTIDITAVQERNYKAVLVGNGMNTIYSFTKTLSVPSLEAGQYTVCITIDDESSFRRCFDLVVSEPAPLSVYSAFNTSDKKLSLNLSGSDTYYVTLNGKTLVTSNQVSSYDLSPGANTLVVKTEKDCQGVFSKSFFIDENKKVYPNPFQNTLFVMMGNDGSGSAKVDVISLGGGVLYSKDHRVDNQMIEVDLSNLSSGTYILKINTGLTESISKIVKQ